MGVGVIRVRGVGLGFNHCDSHGSQNVAVDLAHGLSPTTDVTLPRRRPRLREPVREGRRHLHTTEAPRKHRHLPLHMNRHIRTRVHSHTRTCRCTYHTTYYNTYNTFIHTCRHIHTHPYPYPYAYTYTHAHYTHVHIHNTHITHT